MGTAWNNWFHVTTHTYGSWLPGDPRGHRARHHREHVDGEYQSPPPDTPERRARYIRARSLLKRSPVGLTESQRVVVAGALLESLIRHSVLVAMLCVDSHHAHVLAKFPPGKPTDPWASARLRNPAIARIRHVVGIAKKDAARTLSDRGPAPVGGIWATRSRCQPVADRAHQVSVYRSIERHAYACVLRSGANSGSRDA